MILVTGVAGFIGAEVARHLLERGDTVVGVDNLNSYYTPALKQARLRRLEQLPVAGAAERFSFVQLDVEDAEVMAELFAQNRPRQVVHLAAQARVRYSIENPAAYIQRNLVSAHLFV